MFISIPIGTSTIFGEFHFIFSLQERFVKAVLDERPFLHHAATLQAYVMQVDPSVDKTSGADDGLTN